MNSFTKVRTYVAQIAMFFMAMPCMAQSSKLTYRSGDVNGDGIVNVADISAIINIMAGNYVKDVTLSSYSLSLMKGYGGAVRIMNGSGFYKAESLNLNVVKAEVESLKDGSFTVQITALEVGDCDVIVTDEVTQETQTIRVTVVNEAEEINGSYIDMGLPSGTLWATCNVGSDTPEGNGWYVSWGEIAEKPFYSWSNYWLFSAYNTTDLNDGQDVACVTLGEGWRMPTMEELEELLTCSWSWEMYNGVQGARITGPNGNSIFMPAASFKDNSGSPTEGTYGSYWGRTHANTVDWGNDGMVPCGAELVFGTADYKIGFSLSDFYYEMGPTGGCMVGRSVRPVYDKNYKPNIPDDIKNNYTSYIVNPTYDGNDYSGWEGTPLSGYNPDNNAEHWNMNYDTYQTISGLPKGTYRVGVQGFYRKGYSADDYELWTIGDTDNNNALLYAVSSLASVSTPLAPASSAAISAELSGGNCASVGDGLYIPNNMVAAGAWFKAGYYHNYLDVKVGDNGILTIGIKKDVLIDGDWTIIDNWTLYRIGE